MDSARLPDDRVAAPCGGALKRVLLVDGNVHVLHVMKSSLDRHGYEVDTALATDFATSLYREARHDVVIVDGDAHGRGGEALAAALLGGDAAAGDAIVPGGPGESRAPLVIVIGGAAAGECRAGSGDAPTPERWIKPVSLRYLVARLAEHFGHYDPGAGPAGAAPALSGVGASARPG